MLKLFLRNSLTLMLLLTARAANGQWSAPESAEFDAANNRYFISDQANGKIFQVDSAGQASLFFHDVNVVKGLMLLGDTLFAGAGPNGLVAYDITTPQRLFSVVFPGQNNLNDVAADSSGNVYVSDAQGGKVHKLHLSDMSTETIVTGFTMANGMMFDQTTNRMFICQWITNSPISAIDLSDYSVTPVASDGLNLLDGLTIDGQGHVYVSSFASDVVFRYDDISLTGPPDRVPSLHIDPADIYYNQRDDILVVPNTSGARVDFLSFEPDIWLVGQTIDESAGNGDGLADPGETIELSAIVYNNGQDAINVSGELACDDPFVTITSPAAGFGAHLALGHQATSQTPFAMTIDPLCPDPHIALLEVDFSYDAAYADTDTLYLFIGGTPGYGNDMEGGGAYWGHRVQTRPYVDEWHLDTYRSHSGTTAWKVGGIGATSYADLLDGALITPPILLPLDATLSFWHWIDAERAGGSAAWDGGAVYISTGDGQWQQVVPSGSYPYYLVSTSLAPLGANTACYSGSYDWDREVFDLSAYSGVVQLMFRFGSDGAVNAEGWYIDDIIVGNTPPGTGVTIYPYLGIELTFDEVVDPGMTDVSAGSSGPALPAGFVTVPPDPAMYYDINTTCSYGGEIEICIDYNESDLSANETNLMLLHYDSATWVDATSSVDTATDRVCAQVSSLSCFILAQDLSSCCHGKVGDVNCAGDHSVPDIADMQRLIDFLFIAMDSVCCIEEADVDASGQDHPPAIEDDVDIADMQLLIDHLFINMNRLPPCP